jgi:2-hydroxychromene-2-carboxylate isomerase
MSREPIELWFEFASTYSYLAVARAAQLQVPIRYRSFLLGPVFAAQGIKDSPFNLFPVKGRYMWRDMERLCADAGLPFKQPSQFPRGSILAARLALANEQSAWVGDFARRVYHANFALDLDIGRPEVLLEILSDLKLDAQALRAHAESPEIKQALRERTERAIQLGIFGAPTLRVADELFWGSDRIDQAVRYWERSATLTSG